MSREAELYKDKIEVSLDGRQIFYLFFGGSVIVGLVFVLGVMVGRRVEARGHIDRARVAATVDPLAALDRLEGGNAMSFQGSLRGGAAAPASDVEKQIAALEAKPVVADAKKGDKKPADAKKAEELAKADAVKVDAAKADAAKADAMKADAAKAAAAADAAKAEVKKAEELAKAEAKKADEANKVEAKKAEELAKAEAKKADEANKAEAKKAEDAKKAEEAKKVAAAEPKKEESKKRYTLQLSAFQERSEAEALVASVKAAGFDAYIAEGVVDGKQYFRVRTGTYKSQEAANDAKAELEKVSNKAAIVTKL